MVDVHPAGGSREPRGSRVPPEAWSSSDHEMIQCAKNRGMVELDNGYVVMLVSWRPGARPTARVTYPSGKSARIPGARVVRTIENWSNNSTERRAL